MRSALNIMGTAFRIRLIAAAILIGASIATVRGQEASRTVDRTYEFDERGDAKIEYSFQLSASQWAQWKDQYGDHPDLILRNIKYEFAAAGIDDFALDKDEVHRHAVAKMKARAWASYRGGGEFQIRIPKSMKLVAGSGTDWAFTSSSLENGGIVNITDRAKLPAKAQNVHLTTGNDYNQLVYTLEVTPSRPKAWLELGIVLIIAGAAIGAIASRVGTTTATRPSLPPSLPPALPPS